MVTWIRLLFYRGVGPHLLCFCSWSTHKCRLFNVRPCWNLHWLSYYQIYCRLCRSGMFLRFIGPLEASIIRFPGLAWPIGPQIRWSKNITCTFSYGSRGSLAFHWSPRKIGGFVHPWSGRIYQRFILLRWVHNNLDMVRWRSIERMNFCQTGCLQSKQL